MSARSPNFWLRFDAAVVFASRLHASQRRKGTDTPYVSHLFAVSALVLANGGSDGAVIAALLHDSLEDQGDGYPGGRAALRAEIDARFGREVGEIVDELTDDSAIAKPEGEARGSRKEWLARKQLYIDHARHISLDACVVSCADKLHNLRSMIADHAEVGDKLWRRFRTGSKDDQVWYHAALAAAFRGRASDALVEALDEAVAALKRL